MLKIGPPLFMTASPKKFCFEIAVLPSALFHVAFSDCTVSVTRSGSFQLSQRGKKIYAIFVYLLLITVFQK